MTYIEQTTIDAQFKLKAQATRWASEKRRDGYEGMEGDRIFGF